MWQDDVLLLQRDLEKSRAAIVYKTTLYYVCYSYKLSYYDF